VATVLLADAEDLLVDLRRDASRDALIGEDRGLYEVAWSLEAAIAKAQAGLVDVVVLDEDLAAEAVDYGYSPTGTVQGVQVITAPNARRCTVAGRFPEYRCVHYAGHAGQHYDGEESWGS
jgi:hypothetical protein